MILFYVHSLNISSHLTSGNLKKKPQELEGDTPIHSPCGVFLSCPHLADDSHYGDCGRCCGEDCGLSGDGKCCSNWLSIRWCSSAVMHFLRYDSNSLLLLPNRTASRVSMVSHLSSGFTRNSRAYRCVPVLEGHTKSCRRSEPARTIGLGANTFFTTSQRPNAMEMLIAKGTRGPRSVTMFTDRLLIYSLCYPGSHYDRTSVSIWTSPSIFPEWICYLGKPFSYFLHIISTS